MLSEGTYEAVVASVALGKTSTGKDQIAITFDVKAAEGGTKSITWYGFFTDKAWATTEKAMQAIGWDPNTNHMAFDQLNGTDALTGREASIVVEHEHDDEYGTKARVRWVNAPGGGGMKERMDEAQAADFVTRLRARFGVAPPSSKSRAPQPQHAGGGGLEPDDDDVPF